MPVGKNSIKRVTNNGYSSVKTEAPDMENSVITEKKTEKAIPQSKKSSAAKSTPKKAAPKAIAPKATTPTKTAAKTTKSQKKPTAEKPAVKARDEFTHPKTLEAVPEASKRSAEGYVNLGGELPYYLL